MKRKEQTERRDEMREIDSFAQNPISLSQSSISPHLPPSRREPSVCLLSSREIKNAMVKKYGSPGKDQRK